MVGSLLRPAAGYHPPPATAMEILRTLGGMGQQAQPALLTVLALAREGSSPRAVAALHVALTIDSKSPDLLKLLIEQLRGPDPSQRTMALSLIPELGPASAEAIPDVLKMLAGGSIEEQAEAAEVLGRIGAGRPETVPALRNALQSPQARVASAAAFALSTMGAQAVPAIDDFTRLVLKSPDASTRASALTAIGKLGPEARPAVPAVIRALHDSDAIVQQKAIEAAAKLGPEKEVVAALAEALKDSNNSVCAQAAYALGQLGVAAAPAAPALGAAMIRHCPYVTEALLAIGPAGVEAIPGLLKAPNEGSPQAQDSAALVLGRVGAGRPEILLALRRAVRSPDLMVGGRAVSALLSLNAAPGLDDLMHFVEVSVGPKAWPPFNYPAVVEARESAFKAIGNLGAAGRPAVPALIRLTHSPVVYVRADALIALGKIGPASGVAAALAEALTDSPGIVCSQAAQGLEKLGDAAASAVPAMGAALTKSVCATEIVKALVAIGPASVPALETAARSSNYSVQAAAQGALRKMGRPLPAPPAARAP